MKINEFNQPKKIDEGKLSDLLIGPAASDFFSALFKKGDPRHKRALNIYLNDFVGDASISLDNGIQSGLVDPNLDGTAASAPASTETDPASVTPAPGEPGAVAKPGAAAANKAQAQQRTSQNLNNYVRSTAAALNKTTDKAQKIALTKEIVNAMADRKGYPEWNNALAAVQQIIKRGNVDPAFANAAITNLKAGKTMSEAWRIYFANLLIESVNLTWKDLGICVLKEGANYYIADGKYTKLNYIFESIVEAESGAQSITEYMIDWFDQYMSGVNWKAKENIVIPAIKEIENTYGRDKGKAAMQKLARMAFALSGPAGQMPAGAKNATASAAEPATAASSTKVNPDQLAADLAALSPKQREEVINKVKAATK